MSNLVSVAQMLTLALAFLTQHPQSEGHRIAMTEVLLFNQLGHYWGKSRTWVDGTSARSNAHTP
jgi:hypothetical protein